MRIGNRALFPLILSTNLIALYIFYAIDLSSTSLGNYTYELATAFLALAVILSIHIFLTHPGFSLALAFLIPYLLFLCGRIFVYLATDDLSIFYFSYFATYTPSSDQVATLIAQAAVGYFGFTLGYQLSYSVTRPKTTLRYHLNNETTVLSWARFLLIAGTAILCIIVPNQLLTAYSLGYAAIYLEQTGAYSGSTFSTGLTLLTLGVCLAYTATQKHLKLIALTVYSFLALALAVIGQRGSILSLLIFCFALLLDEKSTSKKFAYSIAGVLSAALLLEFFSAITLREYSLESVTGNAFLDFLYEQGGTLPIYGMSRDILDYPTDAYIQNFVPGYALISNLLGSPLPVDSVSFGAHLSRTLNEELFSLGHGLGWSILGDAIQTLGFAYCLFMIVLGAGVGIVERNKKYTPFYAGLSVLLLLKLPFLPRASVNSVVIPVLYYIAAWLTIRMFSKLTGRRRITTSQVAALP